MNSNCTQKSAEWTKHNKETEKRQKISFSTSSGKVKTDVSSPFEGPALHSKKRTTCSGLMKTALNNVVLPTLFKVVNNTEQVDEPELACNQV